jgi:transcription elongation factor GreA
VDKTITVGSTVSFRQQGRSSCFTLVEPQDASPHDGRISVLAPVAQALIGRRAGERLSVHTPRGENTIEVLGVE